MWVKIVNCSGNLYWYSTMVGEYYEVHDEVRGGDYFVLGGPKWPSADESGDSYRGGSMISVCDAIVVSGPVVTYSGVGIRHKMIN